jgi:hypothetical protein
MDRPFAETSHVSCEGDSLPNAIVVETLDSDSEKPSWITHCARELREILQQVSWPDFLR